MAQRKNFFDNPLQRDYIILIMRLQTMLNVIFKEYTESFVFTKDYFETDSTGQDSIIVEIEPRKNGIAKCSVCGRRCPCYDRSNEPQRFEFPVLLNLKGYFSYRMRRVSCPHCGVKVEQVPWAEGKSHSTKSYQIFRFFRRIYGLILAKKKLQ